MRMVNGKFCSRCLNSSQKGDARFCTENGACYSGNGFALFCDNGADLHGNLPKHPDKTTDKCKECQRENDCRYVPSENESCLDFLPKNPANTGTKHDSGKPDMTLLDKDFLYGVAGVMTHGSNTYGRHNWCKGIAYTRLISATMRHLIAIASGEDTDQDSGLLHVDHVSANCNMLRGMMREKPEMDDRRK